MSEPSTEPSPAEPERPRVGFPCANCGAELAWDPDRDALSCEHCGASVAVPRAEGAILERPLEAAGEAARGLGLEARSVRCGTCGARVVLGGAGTAERCAFCGSASVLVQEANRNALRPESLIPLDVGRAAVEQGFRRWLARLWFRPTALRRVRPRDASGIYVPYWTFDARVHSRWSADAGYYYWVTVMVPVRVGGKVTLQPRQVRKVRWVPAWGERDDAYDDLLVHASRGVSESLAAKLGSFDTAALVPYRAEYLAGWRAEEYELDLEGAWARAREEIVRTQERRCAGDVPGDTHRALRVTCEIDGARWKHVLLPFWSLSYDYAGKTYTVLIHGQSGRVEGEAPLSWAKIALALLAGLAAAGLAALAANAF